LGATLGLTSCGVGSSMNYDAADAPRFDPSLKVNGGVAWVFGSGGPRGFVHIGVIKALDELGLKPNLVVGASVGSLVGALYACGLSGAQMEELALTLSPLSLVRVNLSGPERFAGGAIADLVNERVMHKSLEQLPIRSACVALEQTTMEPVIFNAGNVGIAVQASCAIEKLFAPVQIGGRVYLDPDWKTPVPVQAARQLGAHKVLAIDASAHIDKRPAGAERFTQSDQRKRELVVAQTRFADLVLHPDFGYWVSVTEEFRVRTIEAGYRQTLAQSSLLRAIHRT
jgi:NTE family protein